jgi:pSer/pThr/pTyr-binding forkhead associated (FHA) protein
MSSFLLIRSARGQDVLALDRDRLTIGASGSSDLPIANDSRVSRLHAALESLSGGWWIRDLDSTNGTFVNGARIRSGRRLWSGDEIRVGDTTLILRTEEIDVGPATEGAVPPPRITDRERDVLLELCRPLLSGDVFTEPASIRTVAEALNVTEGAVKQHLLNLYDKFGVIESDARRRVQLANEALHRGAISVADLRHARNQRAT